MFALALAIELIGIAVTGTGIGLEAVKGGETYMAIITAGSCIIAIGGMLFNKVFKRQ